MTTVTSAQCLTRFGDPHSEDSLTLFDVPASLEIGHIPKRIYCNKLLAPLLHQALTNVVQRGLADKIKTWDGCFCIRAKRGDETKSFSLHAWGLAIDINASWNQFGNPPAMHPGLIRCFTDAGFEWGGRWTKPDGMHFQIAKLP